MKPRVIKTDADYRQALAEVERLVAFDPEPDTPDGDALELISTLVADYETRHFPLDFPDPIDAIRFRMAEQGLKQRDLVPFFGTRSRVSEVLSGKRSLTLPMIRALSEGLGIPSEVLVGGRKSGAIEKDEPAKAAP